MPLRKEIPFYFRFKQKPNSRDVSETVVRGKNKDDAIANFNSQYKSKTIVEVSEIPFEHNRPQKKYAARDDATGFGKGHKEEGYNY